MKGNVQRNKYGNQSLGLKLHVNASKIPRLLFHVTVTGIDEQLANVYHIPEIQFQKCFAITSR